MPMPEMPLSNMSATAFTANPDAAAVVVTPNRPAAKPPVETNSFDGATQTAISETPAQPARVASDAPRDTVEVWNVPFDRLDMQQSIDAIGNLIAQDRSSYVVTANLNYCMLHEQDETVRVITKDADLILADGQPIVWRSQLEENPLPVRVAGSEMIIHLCQRAAVEGWRVYFLGGAEGVADICAERLRAEFPGLQIAGTDCPPFRQPTDQEHADQLARIRDAKTDLLFVAFGQPKGEKWIHENLDGVGNACCIQLGASFDFIAGTAVRAPEIYQKLGMEWAYRMMSDPKRLIPRYASNAWYLAKALLQDWKYQVKRWGMWE